MALLKDFRNFFLFSSNEGVDAVDRSVSILRLFPALNSMFALYEVSRQAFSWAYPDLGSDPSRNLDP